MAVSWVVDAESENHVGQILTTAAAMQKQPSFGNKEISSQLSAPSPLRSNTVALYDAGR